jgi:hypothetical protein
LLESTRVQVSAHQIDDASVIQLENDVLRVGVAPEVGGRVVGVFNKRVGHEFLWRNAAARLARLAPGSEYDPNFYGGIDELLPNDLTETIDGQPLPDHGELWMTALAHELDDGWLKLAGYMPVSGLRYERRMRLSPDGRPEIEFRYRVTNASPAPRHFLWKLHAALNVAPSDVIDCPARLARVVDPAYTRWREREPFPWPHVDGLRADVVPAADGSVDFLYLYELTRGEVTWRRPSAGLEFAYRFDTGVFPFVWLFASYGGFLGHYTAVIEPCTTMPISVNDAISGGRCSRLAPGETLETAVTIYAGEAGAP